MRLVSENVHVFPFILVDSNDALYGGHGTFLNKVNDVASRILEDLLLMLRELGDMKLHQRQVSLLQPLFIRKKRNLN